tara:strand:+ start:16650 stop:17033 length:384 start_codon:yes stop_codon:yes gene_type:complete
MSRSSELKALTTNLRLLRDSARIAGDELRAWKKKRDDAVEQAVEIQKEIDQITNKPGLPIITEHALIRYLERVEHLDFEEIKQKILPQDDAKLIDAFTMLGTRQGKFPVGSTHTIVLKDGHVVTIEI